jgi:hypothetical protein
VRKAASTFKTMLQESKLSAKGLVVMDDSGATIQTSSGPQLRHTWTALIVPPAQTSHALQQMDGLQDELQSRFGANELHAHELFQRKGPWAAVPIDVLKGVTAGIARILSEENFPIVVQTFWKGNASQEEFCRKLGRGGVTSIKRRFGLDLRSPKEAAFLFCVWRARKYIFSEYSGMDWMIFADEGIRNPGQRMELPAQTGGGNANVYFEDSQVCKLIQLADFAAFFMTRTQQILYSPYINSHDEELLDILGTSLNYINIPYRRIDRTHPITHIGSAGP